MNHRKWIAIVITCASGLLLVACDNNAFVSPLSIQRDGDSLSVAMCGKPVAIERVFAEDRNSADGAQWRRFWDGTGAVSLDNGEVVSLDPPVEGLTVTINESPLLSEGTELAITMVSVQPGKSLSTNFKIEGGTLPDDSWLHADGSVSALPCGDESP